LFIGASHAIATFFPLLIGISPSFVALVFLFIDLLVLLFIGASHGFIAS